MEIYFDFYSVKVKLSSDVLLLVENIKRDFSYFSAPINKTDIKFVVYNEEIPCDKIPPLKASLYKDNATCYDDTNMRYIDYHGKALVIYDFSNNVGEIYSQDNNFLHELTYLAILSKVGEELDKKGIHRIHALGVSVNNKSVLIILPMGGGKTTLGLELLKYEGVKLLSDDTPLITREGKILPFPVRIGVDKKEKLDIPEEYLRNFARAKYGPKTLIDIDYFKEKISTPSRPAVILIGERISSDGCRIERIPKRKAVIPFIIHGVFGLGFPQLIEYFLRNNIRDIFSKTKILLSRLFVSLGIIRKSKTYGLLIGVDGEENARSLRRFLENKMKCKSR